MRPDVVSGAIVRYCGHDATFLADLYYIGDAVLVVANVPPRGDFESVLRRPAAKMESHHLVDYPVSRYWNPTRGIFFVPASQLKDLR